MNKIAVVSLATPNIQELSDVTFPNKERYCRHHGYEFIGSHEFFAPDRPPSWSKIVLLQRHLSKYDWLFWSDADSVFTNIEIPLDKLLIEDIDFIISKDENGINAGSFMIRNTLASAAFLDRVWEQTQFINHCWWEQAAMIHLIDNGLARIRVRYVEKRAINSYPEDWQLGDLVLHAPGRLGKLRLLTDFLAKAGMLR